jgi:hypothetical protein
VFRGGGEEGGGEGLRESAGEAPAGSALRSAVWGTNPRLAFLHGAAADWGVLDAGDDYTVRRGRG